MAVVVSVLLALLGSLASYVTSHSAEQQHQEQYGRFKEQQLSLTVDHIKQKIDNYQQILLGAASVSDVKGVGALTKSDWETFYKSSQVAQRASKALAIGYVSDISATQLPDFMAQRQADGSSNFAIYPTGDRERYGPITFIEPFNAVNQRALGFDMLTDTARRNAMQAARDSGTFAMSTPVVLRQDEGQAKPPQSVLLYYPIYSGPHATVAERQNSIVAYVYMAFRLTDIMDVRAQALAKADAGYQLSDVTTSPQVMANSATPHSDKATDTMNQDLLIVDRHWRLTQFTHPTTQGWATPTTILLSGLFISFLLGSTIYLLIDRRLAFLRHRHDQELQRTRDELLALASHQLRTPASGVKQYIGMLQAGYFGQLEAEQQSIVDKAAAANDRQLEIIDQLLYVAKADAGQLNLQQTEFDLRVIVDNALANLRAAAEQKSLKVRFLGKKPQLLAADERLISMVVDNLISNAIKYSHSGGHIAVSLSGMADHVQLTVKDEGVGIDPADFGKLFQKFSRIHNELSVTEGGSGLGLYLARVLTEAHGGTLEVESETEKGAVFTLRLPRHAIGKNVAQLTD